MVREIAGAPDIALSEGRSLLANVHDPLSAASSSRSLAVSENWGFAAFETERYKLVVDEDAVAPCQLFDRRCQSILPQSQLRQAIVATVEFFKVIGKFLGIDAGDLSEVGVELHGFELTGRKPCPLLP